MTLFEFWDASLDAVTALFTAEELNDLREHESELWAEEGMGWVTSGYNPADAGCFAHSVIQEHREAFDKRHPLPWNFE